MNINFSYIIYSILIFTSINLNAQEISAPKFGKGLLNIMGKDSTWG